GLAAQDPGLVAELERDLDRGRAAVAVKHLAVAMTGLGRGPGEELLGELDRGLVGEAGEHHVVEGRDLVFDRGDDLRVAVTVDGSPPRADAVEDPPPRFVDQPDPLGRDDRDRGRAFEIAKVGGRVPQHLAVTGAQGARRPPRHGLASSSVEPGTNSPPGCSAKMDGASAASAVSAGSTASSAPSSMSVETPS